MSEVEFYDTNGTICTIGNCVLPLRDRKQFPDSYQPKGVPVSVFDQLLTLAQSYIWLPGLVFVLVVGSIFVVAEVLP